MSYIWHLKKKKVKFNFHSFYLISNHSILNYGNKKVQQRYILWIPCLFIFYKFLVYFFSLISLRSNECRYQRNFCQVIDAQLLVRSCGFLIEMILSDQLGSTWVIKINAPCNSGQRKCQADQKKLHRHPEMQISEISAQRVSSF